MDKNTLLLLSILLYCTSAKFEEKFRMPNTRNFQKLRKHLESEKKISMLKT